jgi:hypothetical protein
MISPTVATAISELATPVLFGSLAGLALGSAPRWPCSAGCR